MTRVGNDADGRWIIATAAALGIDGSLIETDPSLPTGISVITPTEDGHAFDVQYPAAWDRVIGPQHVPNHEALVFGSLPLRDPVAAAALTRLVGVSKGLVALDANLRTPWIDLQAIRRLLPRVGLLKVNLVEAAALGEQAGPAWVCVTSGPEGAVLRGRGSEWSVPGVAVDVVDTVGAGDAFLAVLVDGLVTGVDPGRILEEANRVAAATVSRPGGLPVRRSLPE